MPSAYLYYNATEKVRHMMESYFRLDVPLHFSYSHLVCRTAIAGKQVDNNGGGRGGETIDFKPGRHKGR